MRGAYRRAMNDHRLLPLLPLLPLLDESAAPRQWVGWRQRHGPDGRVRARVCDPNSIRCTGGFGRRYSFTRRPRCGEAPSEGGVARTCPPDEATLAGWVDTPHPLLERVLTCERWSEDRHAPDGRPGRAEWARALDDAEYRPEKP